MIAGLNEIPQIIILWDHTICVNLQKSAEICEKEKVKQESGIGGKTNKWPGLRRIL
jgi:hypothetical protein